MATKRGPLSKFCCFHTPYPYGWYTNYRQRWYTLGVLRLLTHVMSLFQQLQSIFKGGIRITVSALGKSMATEGGKLGFFSVPTCHISGSPTPENFAKRMGLPFSN